MKRESKESSLEKRQREEMRRKEFRRAKLEEKTKRGSRKTESKQSQTLRRGNDRPRVSSCNNVTRNRLFSKA